MTRNDMGRQIALIAGAGPAGLTAALELLRRSNIQPVIIEADSQVGGISKTINYRGNRKHKDEVIHQIATALKIEFYELIKGTSSEPPPEGPSQGFFPYGPKSNDNAAFLHNLYQGLPFRPQKIKIMGRQSTIEENEAKEGKNCYKFVTLERGQVDLVIKHRDGNTERITLVLDEGYKFDSGELHHFENKSKQISKVFVVSYLENA